MEEFWAIIKTKVALYKSTRHYWTPEDQKTNQFVFFTSEDDTTYDFEFNYVLYDLLGF